MSNAEARGQEHLYRVLEELLAQLPSVELKKQFVARFLNHPANESASEAEMETYRAILAEAVERLRRPH